MSDSTSIDDNVCKHNFIGTVGINIIVPGAGSFLLGITRIFAFTLLLLNNFRNMKRLKRYEDNSLDVARGLVLPSYFPCIYSLMTVDAISGLFDIILSSRSIQEQTRLRVYAWLLPLESGVFHSIFEGIAIFTLMYGAGRSSFRHSVKYGSIWGLFTAIILFISFRLVFDVEDGTFYINDPTGAYVIFLTYNIMLLTFYLCFIFIPNNILYKRPAATTYAIFNVILTVFWITMATVIRYDSIVSSDICGFSIAGLFLIALLQPGVVWYTLMKDSQYWQGLVPDEGNPLSAVWDQIDVKTALSMSDVLTAYERDKKSQLSLLHFGLITLDRGVGFVAGGFSRVYFGKLRHEPVALKVMFAMELTAKDIAEFFYEAKVLQQLSHENIVTCKGVCVMPPAVGIVLERCAFGSLFDFIHKNKAYDDFCVLLSPSFLQSNPSILTPGMLPSLATAQHHMHSHKDHNSSRSAISKPIYEGRKWGISSLLDEDSNKGDSESSIENPIISLSSKNASFQQMQIEPSESSEPDYYSHKSISLQSITALRSAIDISSRPESKRPSVRFSPDDTSISLRQHDEDHHRPTMRASESSATSSFSSKKQAYQSWSSKRLQELIRSGLSFGRNRPSMKPTDDATASMPPAYRLTYTMRHKMMLDVIRAMIHVHKLGYIHSDIKSLNFLVTDDFRVKLSDMGETRRVEDPPKRDGPIIPAKNWAPPEVLHQFANSRSYTMKSDIYGMSIVLTELLTLSLPFGDQPELMAKEEWFHKLAIDNIRPELTSSTSAMICDIMQLAWHTDPLRRPTAEEIYEAFDASLPSQPSETV